MNSYIGGGGGFNINGIHNNNNLDNSSFMPSPLKRRAIDQIENEEIK
jgi:hypothetical protein